MPLICISNVYTLKQLLFIQVQNEEHSGWNENDFVDEALSRFKSRREQANASILEMHLIKTKEWESAPVNQRSSKPPSRPTLQKEMFLYMNCYNVLKKSAKFMRSSSQPRKRLRMNQSIDSFQGNLITMVENFTRQ